MSDHDLDVLDRPLREAFERAHTDTRWAGRAWPDPVPRVRAGVRVSRVRTTALAGAAVIVLAGVGGVLVTKAAQPAVDSLRAPIATQGGGSGLDWLLTPEQYDAYSAAHPSPSAGPQKAPSPAPIDADARRLEADVTAAVGSADPVRLDPADGGDVGHAVLWLHVDGTPLAVERYRLRYPLVAGDQAETTAGAARPGGAESFTAPQEWPDGTAYTVATGTVMGYAFGADERWSGPVVWTVTPDGWLTSWTAPVPAQQLLAWAHAAEEHDAAGS